MTKSHDLTASGVISERRLSWQTFAISKCWDASRAMNCYKTELRHRSSVVEQLLCKQSVVRSNRDRWHQFRRCGGSALPETESMSPEQSWLICRLISAPDLYPPRPSDERLLSSDAAGSGADFPFAMRRTTLAQRGGYRHGKRSSGVRSRPSPIEGRVAMLEQTVERLMRLVGDLVKIESGRVDDEIAEIGSAIKRYNERKAASSLTNGERGGAA